MIVRQRRLKHVAALIFAVSLGGAVVMSSDVPPPPLTGTAFPAHYDPRVWRTLDNRIDQHGSVVRKLTDAAIESTFRDVTTALRSSER